MKPDVFDELMNMEPTLETMKYCPSCKQVDGLKVEANHDSAFVECRSCGMRGPTGKIDALDHHKLERQKAMAINSWNRLDRITGWLIRECPECGRTDRSGHDSDCEFGIAHTKALSDQWNKSLRGA